MICISIIINRGKANVLTMLTSNYKSYHKKKKIKTRNVRIKINKSINTIINFKKEFFLLTCVKVVWDREKFGKIQNGAP